MTVDGQPSLLAATRTAAHAIEQLRDADRAAHMRSYMKDHFDFFGVPAGPRRAVQKPATAAARTASAADLLAAGRWCWRQRHREVQYLGADLLRAGAGNLDVVHLADVREFIETRSWWDTIDALAAHTVGAIVRADRAGSTVMDDWIDDDNVWVARTAILHQLAWRDDAEPERLFAYALARGGDDEFFIRKALGWALRSLARAEPGRVEDFVDKHRSQLSTLTIREATKRL